MNSYGYADIAKMIDHSLLSPTMTEEVLEEGCRLAIAYDVASVCLMPFFLRRCADLLADSNVKATTTIGFPHGANAMSVKAAEAKQAIADGGVELDVVVNVSKVLSGRWEYVQDEIRAVADTVHSAGAKVKIIFENCYLRDDHKIRLCEIASEANADWVKTSTGFGTSGATREDVALMRKHAAPHVQVKASGGIRDLDTVLSMRSLGATRCGISRTAPVLDDLRGRLGMPAAANPAVTAQSGY